MWLKKRKLLAILLGLIGSPAFADTLTIPYTFTAGTTIQSSQMNSNFTTLTSWSTTIANDNIKSGAAIALSKLDATTEMMILRAAGNRGLSVGVTGDTVPRVSLNTLSGGAGYLGFGAGSASAQDLLLKRTDANTLAIRNLADSADKNLTLGDLTASGAVAITGALSAASLTIGAVTGTGEISVLRAAGNRLLSGGVTADTVPRVSLVSTSGGVGGVGFGAGGASAQDVALFRSASDTLAVRNLANSADNHLTAGNLTASGTLGVTGASTLGNVSLTTVTAGAWNGTVIGTTYGGTGANLSAASAGDLPYFSGGSAMTRLTIAGNGNKFIRANAGATAPEYVALIPVTAGGTGTDLSSAAAGSVPYFTSSSAMSSLPASGNGSKFIRFNSGATAIEAASAPGALGGDGSDGATTLTNSTVSGPKQYNATTLSVTAANTVTHDTASPFTYNATSTITVNGTITLTGVGHSGGTGAAAGSLSGKSGSGPGGGGGVHSQSAAVGGGGGGSFGAGGRGGAASGTTFGCPGGSGNAYSPYGGSGGGGGQADGTAGAGGAGGAGGGKLIMIATDTISVPSGGTINALGSAGSNATASSGGGGGGGGGGDVWLISTKSSGGVNVAVGGTINVSGGAAGNDNGTGGGGGGGGGGRIRGWCPGGATLSGTLTVAGGANGTGDQNGESGGAGSSASITGTPNYPLLTWTLGEGGKILDQMCTLATSAHGEHIVQVGQRDLAWAAGNNLEGFCYFNSADTIIVREPGKGVAVCGDLFEVMKNAA